MPALEDLIRGELYSAADQGQPDMTPREVEALTVRLARKLRPQLLGEPASAGRPANARSKAEEPTKRQVQVLDMLADSAGIPEVAAAYGISVATVHDHLRALARRWDLPVDVCRLVNAGFERGWLRIPGERRDVALDLRDLTALGLLAAGREREVGEVLGVSERVVASQRTRLLLELGALTDAGLVAAGWRAGLLPVAPVSAVAS